MVFACNTLWVRIPSELAVGMCVASGGSRHYKGCAPMISFQDIILPSDPRAAELSDVQVWKSRRGGYFIDEAAARHDGATHVFCSICSQAAQKPYHICDSCRDLKDAKHYDTAEVREWDRSSCHGDLYSSFADKYMDIDEIVEYCVENSTEDNVLLPSKLRLYLCKHVPLPLLEDVDLFPHHCGVAFENGYEFELPENIALAIQSLNDLITSYNERGAAVWDSTKYRPSDEVLAELDALVASE